MAGDDDKKHLQDMQAEIDGLVTYIKTIHKRVDSTVTTTNARFD
jgi:archaellum component FlaC